MVDNEESLARIIRQRRFSASMSLSQLAARSGISQSHLGRIERQERFPSVRTLQKIARPLGFDENELLVVAGYLSPRPVNTVKKPENRRRYNELDPFVAQLLAREPLEVQNTVIGILRILKSLARCIDREQHY